MNKIEYALVDVSTAADNVVTLEECDILWARVVVVLSAVTWAIENGNGGDVLGTFLASAAVGAEFDFKDGIRLSNGINLAGTGSNTGKILVAYRTTSQV